MKVSRFGAFVLPVEVPLKYRRGVIAAFIAVQLCEKFHAGVKVSHLFTSAGCFVSAFPKLSSTQRRNRSPVVNRASGGNLQNKP